MKSFDEFKKEYEYNFSLYNNKTILGKDTFGYIFLIKRYSD